MINPQELRLNNWVSVGAHLDKVTGIEFNMLHTACYSSLGYNEIEPIPLTPEILEAAGFEKNGNYYCYGNFHCRYSEVLDSNFLFFGHISWTTEKEIKYLHQLQNLIFALTGEELTIKEIAQ